MSRGRQQRITGKVLFQVETLKERETEQCGIVTDRQYFTAWRDASLEESFKVQHGVGLVAPELVAKAKGREA
ncbi:hypothetical protein EGJ31_09100 [Serratia marcescens]|nr:hypothetical protein [Serratia marcescens]OMP55978.1 hypothetical protein BES32_03730 [Serratia marcescens]RRT98602.1 hypothetical protein EGI90_14245 [Serratia marcescens]RRU21711.1 hypothetical protein EGJ10_09665 [Serratia marcescens]RRU22960.1 hypothetical protein EGJ16_05380 [Serratia marcescens]